MVNKTVHHFRRHAYEKTDWLFNGEKSLVKSGDLGIEYREMLEIPLKRAEIIYAYDMEFLNKYQEKYEERTLPKRWTLFFIIVIAISVIAMGVMLYLGRDYSQYLVVLFAIWLIAIIWRVCHYRKMGYYLAHVKNRIQSFTNRTDVNLSTQESETFDLSTDELPQSTPTTDYYGGPEFEALLERISKTLGPER